MDPRVKRFGKVIGVKSERLEEYKRLHVAVWPEVNAMMTACQIRNFTIFLRKLNDGNDYETDMAKVAADPATQEWWKLTDPCQQPLADRAPDEWWADMEEVCHHG